MNIEASWLDLIPGVGKIRAAGRLNAQARELLNRHRQINEDVDRQINAMKELSAKATECLDLSKALLDSERKADV